MVQSASVTEEVTARVREMYRLHPFPSPQRKHTYRHHAAYVHRLLDEFGLGLEGKTFGDIACGTGLMMLDYSKEFPETEFLGYDISEQSVARANQTLKAEGSANATCVLQDIMNMQDSARFDYILSWGTIHHLTDRREGVRRLCRALKPGGIIRTGVYGYYGNWERRIQREAVSTICRDILDPTDFGERIKRVREWAVGDRNFKNYYTAPAVDLTDDDWAVDELLHVWEKHITLRELVTWLQEEGMEILRMTDYYDQEIPLDITQHSTSAPFIARVYSLPFADQCHVVDMIVRPYWLSVFARKVEA